MRDLDEAIHLESHRAKWATDFAVERERLRNSLGVDLGHVEHIGSTAVPGLEAKPIIDIMVGLSRYPPFAVANEQLAALGYEALGEAGVPGRTYFRLRGNRSINLHVVELGARHWVRNLALRDHLRNSALAREKYAKAKRAALASGKETLLSYSAAKSPIIAALLSEAGVLDNDG